MTQESINKAIENCYWRNTEFGSKEMGSPTAICKGYCLPCNKVVEQGRCDTLIELFSDEVRN
ncbi:MAG: hypothetical protein IKP66_02545 [Lachnospiraceae bacterium]|nr:hypothetical protein [Lachnospiraceae bacterium]